MIFGVTTSINFPNVSNVCFCLSIRDQNDMLCVCSRRNNATATAKEKYFTLGWIYRWSSIVQCNKYVKLYKHTHICRVELCI